MLRLIPNNENSCSHVGYALVRNFFRQKLTLALPITVMFLGTAIDAVYAKQPTAFTHEVQPVELVERIVAEPIDLQAVQLEDQQRELEGAPYRFAIPRPTLLTVDKNGTWEQIDDETWLWRLRISSPGALSLNLGFTRYHMPPGGILFIYSADGNQVLGPFTDRHNEDHGQLWTPVVLSDEIVVELTIPAASVPQLELELTAINHGYRGFGMLDSEKSGTCNIDVNCPEGDPWRDQIRSVAVYHRGGDLICTGVLVNNTAEDDTPYFLTANHCGIDAGNAASMVVYWNYERPNCGSGSGSLNQYQSGAYFRAAYTSSDFTLVELDDDPDCSFNVYFAGWSKSSVAPSSAVAIHHPSCDEKSISFEYDSTCISGWPIDEDDCGEGTDHIRIDDWDPSDTNEGTTESGSSGCPLFDTNKRIVGQLHGGDAACDNDLPDWFGRFYTSWTGGGTNSTRLSNWLDPIGTGQLTLDGKDSTPCGDGCQEEYPSTDVPKTIPDPGITTSTLDIVDTGTIVDLNVKLDITHTWDSDLDVYLIAPDSTRVELFTDVGSSGNNFSNTILDDEASVAITSGSAPFDGSYQPEGNLSDFDGKSITGTWTLEITDDAGADSGTLTSWSLIIETPCDDCCPTTITSCSYTESFESDFGDWINSEGDDIDWTRYTGSTPSSNTGPSSAYEGSYYLYTEASSSGYPNKQATLDGPCFDLSSLSNPGLRFWYHMYGDAMGSLSVEVSDNNCASWTPVWSLFGDQGNSWYEAVVNLSAYSGSTIKVRFVAVTGSSYTSDMAIDYVTVEGELDAPVLHSEPNITPGLRNTIWWDPVADANGYYAQCANDANFANIVTGSGWISETSYTFTGLDLGYEYWYRVKAAPLIESWSQTSQAEFQTDTLVDAIATADGNVVLAGGGSTIFQDDFEDGDMVGWTAGAGSYTREVTSATAAAGSLYSITLIGGSNSHHDGVSHDLSAITPDDITFYVRSSDAGKADGYFVVGTGPDFNTQTAVFFYTKDNGQMGVYDGTTFWGTSYTSLTWYKVRFAFNWTFKEIDYYVNDTLVKGGITFRSTSVSSLTKVYLYNYHNSQSWWDEIQFSTGSGGGYVPLGDIVSTAIDLPADGNWAWAAVRFAKTMPSDTALSIDVLNAADDSVILADVNSRTDINWIAATELKLRANLSTDDPNNTPVLRDWSVSYAGPCQSDWSNVESSLQCDTLCDFDNNNEINFIDFAILAGQWLRVPGSPSADIAPEVPDNFVDFLDLEVFVENWLLDLTCTVQN